MKLFFLLFDVASNKLLGRNLQIFELPIWKIDDFINSFWLYLTIYVMFLNIYNKLLWASGGYLEKIIEWSRLKQFLNFYNELFWTSENIFEKWIYTMKKMAKSFYDLTIFEHFKQLP